MFTYLLTLLVASASVVAKPAPEPGVVIVAHNVGGCASGFPVCCEVVGHNYSENAGCNSIPNVSLCGNSTTALCCDPYGALDVGKTGTASNCTVSS